MTLKQIKSDRLREVAVEAMRGECYRQLAATGGNVKAAGINLGYSANAFYAVLARLGIKLERVTRIKKAD